MSGKLTKAEAGLIGARRRWGDTPRTVRIDELDPTVARAVLALVAADDAMKKGTVPNANGTALEVRHATADTTAA